MTERLTPLLLVALAVSNCALENGSDEIIGSRKAEDVRDLTLVQAKYIVTPTTSTIQCSKQDPLVKKVKAGDVVVSDVNTTSPAGYMKRPGNDTEDRAHTILAGNGCSDARYFSSAFGN